MARLTRHNKVPSEMKWQLGKNLVNARLARGYDQKRFAELLSVNPSVVSCWETGRCFPTFERLTQICVTLEINRVQIDPTIR